MIIINFVQITKLNNYYSEVSVQILFELPTNLWSIDVNVIKSHFETVNRSIRINCIKW